MKYFLSTCIGLMLVAGIYGATDMTRDLKNDELIDYENVRYRHAKHLLAIIKTTGLGTHKFRGSGAGKEVVVKERQEHSAVEKKKIETYFEEFSRGDVEEELFP